MEEIWKTIPDFPNYSASTHGRIRRDAKGTSARPGTIMKPCAGVNITKEGKPVSWSVRLYRDGKQHSPTIHRLVLETFVSKRPEGMECCHNDGDSSNNRLENLRWDSNTANRADMIRHGTSTRGEKSHNAKLTEAEVKEIKRSLERFSGYGACAALGKEFGVSMKYISQIKCGRSWEWL